MMNTKLVKAIGVVIFIASGQVMAMSAAQCVTLTGNGNLTNGCTETLLVHYCVDDAKSDFPCAHSGVTFGGQKTLQPGATEHIPDYSGGDVRWAACGYPQSDVGWDGRSASSTYICR